MTLGGSKMNRLDAYDKAVMARDNLKLLWVIHTNIEGMDEEELNLYRMGVQTFLLQAQEEIEGAIKALEDNDEDEDDAEANA